MKTKNSILILAFLLSASLCYAQKKKVRFIGGARSLLSNNQLSVADSIPDTTSVPRNTGGYALIDLGVNISPNENTEIMGMFRIKNDYGGFWGAGVNFDVRQLWLKGIIAQKVRYQLGDINIKQTPFTLYNHHADRIDSLPEIFALQNRIIDYEKFYGQNTWRQQGVNVDFGFQLAKFIKEIDVNAYALRVNASNFANIPERLMGGFSVGFKPSDNWKIGLHKASIFDIKGTVSDSNSFRNNVNTATVRHTRKIGENKLILSAEGGTSNQTYTHDTLAPELSDYFVQASAKVKLSKLNLSAEVGYLNVGPDFRSPGAQSKDINYGAAKEYYPRYTNDQTARPLNIMDVISQDVMYRQSISSGLMQENQLFNNVLPYGVATFNRNGLFVKLNYRPKSNSFYVNTAHYALSEIRGLGAEKVKSFLMNKINAGLNVDKLMKMKNKFLIHGGASLQNTTRNSSETISNIKLNSNIIHAGLEYELFENMYLLGGYCTMNSVGNEFTTRRNDYSVADFYTRIDMDIQQELLGAGLKYQFTDKIYLSGMMQKTSFTDRSNSTADYSINQFAIIYNMTF